MFQWFTGNGIKEQKKGENDMADRYDVAVKVVSQKGECAQKHKVGEEWVISRKTPEGICLSAFNCMLPSIRVFMFGGRFPWTADPDVTKVACTDAECPVVFELRRLRK